ncbi:MAG: iron-only hydrogenase system regulator [Bacteroidales bacterium]|nr:iron-only hydrogenase system regulator [Bacteroidales bacterium]
MEKRIGSISILISNRDIVPQVNELLSEFAEMILARQGLPMRDKGIHFISLIIEGTTDQISALTGKLGRLPDVEAKSMVAKLKTEN